MGCRVSTQQGSNIVEARKDRDEAPLATQRRLHSGPVHRLVYHNTSLPLGASEGSDTEKCEDKFHLDNPLELRAVSSSALLTKTTNFTEEELPGSPSFRFYLEDYLKFDLNKGSNLDEKQVGTPIHEQTGGMLNKPHQLMDTSKPWLLDKETQSTANKKKKGWKFKFFTKKNKNSRNKAPPQVQALVTSSRLSREHAAAVMLQKVIRGFLLRKQLRILRNIDATAEEFGKQVANYEENLERDGRTNLRVEDNFIMQLLSQLNSVRVSMVYKRKVIQKIMSLQKTVNVVAGRAYKLDLDTQLKKSGVVADFDELTVESFNFSKMQHNMVVETGSTMKEALRDNTYSIGMQGNETIIENTDWDLYEEDESDIVMDFYVSTAQNPNTFTIEEKKRVKAVNLMEEPTVDGQEKECDKGDTMMAKVDLDLIELQKEFDVMVELEKSMKHLPNFDQNDEVSLIEEISFECKGLTKTPETEEMGKTSNGDENFIEKELNSNDPDTETMDKVYDPKKYKTLLEIFQKLKNHEEFDDHALELSQLETCYNQTKEKEIKGLKEFMEELKDLSTESEEMKTRIKWLENRIQELGKTVQRIERGEERNIKNIGRKCESFN